MHSGADELEVQRRSARGILTVCIGKFRKVFRANRLVFQKT
jgi:hypothetical protein